MAELDYLPENLQAILQTAHGQEGIACCFPSEARTLEGLGLAKLLIGERPIAHSQGASHLPVIKLTTKGIAAVQGPPRVIEYHGIGGSQAAAVVGEHPYCPPIQVWSELVGDAPPFEGNELTKWGKLLEAPIREDYAARHGYEVLVPDEPYYKPDMPWVRASPDGLIAGSHGLEVKTGDKYTSARWGATGGDASDVPPEYRIQCAWYMWVYDLGHWDVCALLGGNELREFTVVRDMSLEVVLVEAVTAFWENHVLTHTPPEIDGSNAYAEYIARRSFYRPDEIRERSVRGDNLAAALRALHDRTAQIDVDRALLKNKIRDHIGDASGVDTAEGRITWKLGKGSSSWKEVALDLADQFDVGKDVLAELVDAYRDEPSRTLRPPTKKWNADR